MGVPPRIGRYQILGELGQGAMGTVYRGRDEMLDRDVAVKVMSKGLTDAHARERFLKEARAAARLQHPNIVVIYELGEHEGAPFMVLELLEGVDLQRAIDSGIRPDPRATLPVVLQLLAGLGHAHEHGIVHRDVKPSNLFLPFGRPAKIMDFGVARLAGQGMTTSGVVVGTASYMSPEQASAGEIDGRSDLFSAGLILYELVTGEKAYQADSIVAMIYKIMHEPPDLSLIPEGRQWERLRAVLERALARRPEDRYPDARAMSHELGHALSDLGGTVDPSAPADQALLVRPKPTLRAAPPAEGPRPVPRPAAAPARARPAPIPAPTRPSPLAVGLGVAVLVALGASGAWLWLRPGSGPAPSFASPVPASPSPAPEPSGTAPAPPVEPSPTPLATVGPATAATPAPAEPSPAATSAAASAGAPTPLPATPTPTAAPGHGAEARLLRAEDLVQRGRWPEALAEARAVLETQPTSTRAAALAQQAEAEMVIEECLRNARAALQSGDRERALEEVRRGFLVRKNDPRLLAMHREIVQQ
jgi:eukaryotic-like serine/threonine-protein kinase